MCFAFVFVYVCFVCLAYSGHMDVERLELEKCLVFRILTRRIIVYAVFSVYRPSEILDCIIW